MLKFPAVAALLLSTVSAFSQTTASTAQLSTIQKYNPFRVQGGGTFDKHLFQADALLRLGDVITTKQTVFDGTGRYYEKDPIAPGENHSVALMYAFQLGAHVAVIQGHNLLVRHNHPKFARALVVADVVMEAYTVSSNARLETRYVPMPSQSVAPSTSAVVGKLPTHKY